jgi:hypothetical protein
VSELGKTNIIKNNMTLLKTLGRGKDKSGRARDGIRWIQEALGRLGKGGRHWPVGGTTTTKYRKNKQKRF